MTDQDKRIADALQRMAASMEEIGRQMKEINRRATGATRSFGELMSQADKDGVWPPYDH